MKAKDNPNNLLTLPWREMAKTRDKLIHDYFGVNMEEVLDFVEYLKIKSEKTSSGIDESSLRFQQKNLKKIWDHPEEDLYEL